MTVKLRLHGMKKDCRERQSHFRDTPSKPHIRLTINASVPSVRKTSFSAFVPLGHSKHSVLFHVLRSTNVCAVFQSPVHTPYARRLSAIASALHSLWSSPRPISSSQLRTLLHFHLCPINLIVSKGTYLLEAVGDLISGGASRLDAFSVYPFRTWLPCYALGRTAGTPAVRPARSSRTKASSLQISCAHAG